MSERAYRTTQYFDEQVVARRSHLTIEMCVAVIERPVRTEVQADGRVRHWAFVEALGGRALRVITLEDGLTIHNAFIDGRFRG